jgi:hypothetical protein
MFDNITIENNENQLRLIYKDSIRFLPYILVTIIITSYFTYITYTIVNSKKITENIELAIGLVFLLTLLNSFILYQVVYKGIKYSKNKSIELINEALYIDGEAIYLTEIINILKYEVPSKYNLKYYIVLEIQNRNKEVIAIRLNERESQIIASILEKYIGKKSKTIEKYFEFMVI